MSASLRMRGYAPNGGLRRPPACRLSSTADRKAVDPERRLADADGHALALFAASADAGIEREIVADHGDPREHVGAGADQRRAFHRISDLAVFDHVRFGRREDELAAGDVDLAAAEIDRVEPALDRRDDF